MRRVRDRSGVVLEDNTAVCDPMGAARACGWIGWWRWPGKRAEAGHPAAHRLADLAAAAPGGQQAATAPPLRTTGLPAAGKTGTSSATMDTWFVGYTSRWMTTTWIGDDKRERPLGHKDAAFMLDGADVRPLHVGGGRAAAAAGDPLGAPRGVKPNDTGGRLRTTMEEVKDDLAAVKKPRT